MVLKLSFLNILTHTIRKQNQYKHLYPLLFLNILNTIFNPTQSSKHVNWEAREIEWMNCWGNQKSVIGIRILLSTSRSRVGNLLSTLFRELKNAFSECLKDLIRRLRHDCIMDQSHAGAILFISVAAPCFVYPWWRWTYCCANSTTLLKRVAM